MRISREFTDLAAASALSALLFAAGALLPLVGPPAGFLSSAPLIWLAARHGLAPGCLGGLLAAAVLLPALPPPVVLIFAIEHALPAGYLGWHLARGRSIAVGSAIAALVVALLVAGAAFLLLDDSGRDPIRAIEEQLRVGLSELEGVAPGEGSPPGKPPALSPAIEEVIALLRRVLPAVTLIGIFIECSLNLLVVSRLLKRGGSALPERSFTGFALPDRLVWVLIPALALSWAPQPAVSTVALNILLPLLFAYLLQGFSILLHLAARAGLSRFGRMLGALAFGFFPWLLAAPLLLGMLDFRFDFRARWPIRTPGA
jgi:uncharacterized protein YybS (DUF2232 family)